MMRATIGILLSLAAAGRLSAASPQSPADAAAVRAADAWVRLLDDQRWAGSWTAAGKLFHGQVTQARWTAMIRPARQPIGAVTARSFKSATRAKSLPGAPDGDYELVQYASRFTRKQQAIETVILAREGAGWKVAGYFLR